MIFGEIAKIAPEFFKALKARNFGLAGELMVQEPRLRLQMTPEVLDKTGKKLLERAVEFNCGARFTGAGGGGCLWAVGEKERISGLAPVWREVLESVADGHLLPAKIDTNGILIET